MCLCNVHSNGAFTLTDGLQQYFSQNWWDSLLYSALQPTMESLSNNFPIKQTAQRWPSPISPCREMPGLEQFIYMVKQSSFYILH